jgi:MYXO-CTERM domain-containing protein
MVAAQPCVAAKVPRTVLKSYFETGDKPTQAQFADVIDSALNLVDDGLVGYSASDSGGLAPRFDAGATVGPGLAFAPLSGVQGFSDDWLGQSGFLPLAYLQDSQLHYAYLQISSPVPGSPNAYSMSVEYLVFENLADTALVTTTVPEPSSLALAAAALVGLFVWRRRAKR